MRSEDGTTTTLDPSSDVSVQYFPRRAFSCSATHLACEGRSGEPAQERPRDESVDALLGLGVDPDPHPREGPATPQPRIKVADLHLHPHRGSPVAIRPVIYATDSRRNPRSRPFRDTSIPRSIRQVTEPLPPLSSNSGE